MPPKVWCDCTAYCNGGKHISERSWRRHAEHRRNLSTTFENFQAGLQFDPGNIELEIDMGSDSDGDSRSTSQSNDFDIPFVGDDNEDLYDDAGQDYDMEQGFEMDDSGGVAAPALEFEPEFDEMIIFDSGTDSETFTDDPGSDDDPDCLAALEEADEAPAAPAQQEPIPQPVPAADGAPDDDAEDPNVTLDNLKLSIAFIDRLKNARLEDDGLHPDVLEQLRNPTQEPFQLNNPDLRLAIDLFVDHSNQSYEKTRQSILRRHPEDELLSHDQICRKVCHLTGIDSVVHDMCPKVCVAYTGPFAELEACPICGEPRYDPIVLQKSHGRTKQPQRQFHTMPVGPQLQALYGSVESAHLMGHRHRRTEEILANRGPDGKVKIENYDDVYVGSDYLEAVDKGHISPDDITLMFSIDGAQLYQKKTSDCWIFIWVVFNLPPDLRYKKKYVIIGAVIPGPYHPQFITSFLYPSLHHLIALQKEGLYIFHPIRREVICSNPYFHFGTADSVGIIHLNGFTGHKGAYSCRLYCAVKGRRKASGKQYYPALLKPVRYNVPGCNHDDISIRDIPPAMSADYKDNLAWVLASPSEDQFTTRRRETGISRPSIISAISERHGLGVPRSFPGDLTHLVALNTTDLLLDLWRGTMDCDTGDSKQTWDWAVLKGDVWKAHGKVVASATPHLPGSFDRPPRNPAEKISSGYKAWEFLNYVFGLGPAVFYQVLPERYWRHFCKLVTAIRIFHQKSISPPQLIHAHRLILEYCNEFELLYYQRRPERLHFCRPSVHALLHIGAEVPRTGPQVYYTQWTMERTIGNLGEEIKQHSNPYANLSQRAVRRGQINALKAMIPDLDPNADKIPRGAKDLGDGFLLLRARDETPQELLGLEATAVKLYLQNATGEAAAMDWVPRVKRWARLKLPNGQIARSTWKEKGKTIDRVRMARNVKFVFEGKQRFGEVQFYFQAHVDDQVHSLAVVSLYSLPDEQLLESSYHSLVVCTHDATLALIIIEVQAILSVVAMVPFTHTNLGPNLYYVVEKLGLEVASLGGVEEEAGNE